MRWLLLMIVTLAVIGCRHANSNVRDSHPDVPTGRGLPFLDPPPHWGKWTPEVDPG